MQPQEQDLRRRLRTKSRAQAIVVGWVLVPEEPARRKTVYLVSFSHPTEQGLQHGLRAPETLTRQQLLDAILDSFAHPVYADAGNIAGQDGRTQLKVLKMVVFLEYHKPDAEGVAHIHYHVALVANATFRFAPIKRSLRTRHNLASHWSCSHDAYWSAVRYCFWPSPPQKPRAALDKQPLAWKLGGEHEALEYACEEPSTAPAIASRLLKRRMDATEEGKPEPRPSEIDVWPLVVRHGIRNTDDNQEAYLRLIEVATDKCSPAMVQFLFRIRRKLPGLIDDVWKWHEIKDHVRWGHCPRANFCVGILPEYVMTASPGLGILRRHGQRWLFPEAAFSLGFSRSGVGCGGSQQHLWSRHLLNSRTIRG